MKIIPIIAFTLFLTACGAKTETMETTQAESAPTDTISLTDSTSQNVDAVSGATSTTTDDIKLNGTIVIPAQRIATVAMTMGGIVKQTSILSGERVSAGTVLATLENPEFITLQQSFIDNSAQTEYLAAEYNRQLVLAKEQAASQKKLQQSRAEYLSAKVAMEAAAAQLKLLGIDAYNLLETGIIPYLEIKAPMSGYITDAQINIGKYIDAGEPICEIIDKSNVRLKLITYEKDLSRLNIGDNVAFRVNGMGNATFRAKIVSIGQKVDAMTRSLDVYAQVEKNNTDFRPGMYVTALIKR